jgi:predicted nuclease of predicted toxin-antitoxin system
MARFLVDEDLPRSLKRALIAAGLDAEDVRDVGLQGHLDPDVFAYAVANRRALVTADVGFGDLRVYVLGTHAGIILARFPSKTPVAALNAAILARVRLLADDDIEGNLIVIDPNKMRIRRTP